MEQRDIKPRMSEQEAARYLRVSVASLRMYAQRGKIPCVIRVLPRKGRGQLGYMYEFRVADLDIYDEARQESNRRKGPRHSTSGSDRYVSDEEIARYLNTTTLTLGEIGAIAGVSRERVRQIGKKLGARSTKTRLPLRSEEKNKEKNQRAWGDFLEGRPPWYRAFQDACAQPERAIAFKPYATYGQYTGLRFSYRAAFCNGRMVHLHHATFRFFKGLEYAVINMRSPIPKDHFLGAVGARGGGDEEEQFYFWIIPGSIANAWREEHSRALYLAPSRQVRRPYGLGGYEETRSPWAQWYERWDLLAVPQNPPVVE